MEKDILYSIFLPGESLDEEHGKLQFTGLQESDTTERLTHTCQTKSIMLDKIYIRNN